MFFEKAKPIWAKGREEELNLSLAFSSGILQSGEYLLKITSSCFYRASIDGKFLGYGPARAPHGYFRVDEYSFNALGESTLTLEVAGYNTKSFYALDQTSFLQAEIVDGNGKVVYATGENQDFCCVQTDRVSKVLRFSYQRPFTEYYIQGRVKERLEVAEVKGGELLERKVKYPRFNDKYADLIESGEFSSNPNERKINLDHVWSPKELKIYPYERLERCAVPFINSLEYSPRKDKTSDLKSGEYAVYNLNEVAAGFIGLNITVNEPSTVHIIFDEVDLNEGKGAVIIDYLRNNCYNTISYELVNGKHQLLSFDPFVEKYIKIIVEKGSVKIDGVFVKKYENPFFEDYTFTCDNQKIKKVVVSAARTFAHNSVDILTDCPSRERAGFLCDGMFSGRSERFFTGENIVERNFLENFALMPKIENIPEEMLPMCYPADFESELFIPNWAMWFVLQLKDYFVRTGDREIVDLAYKKVENLIKYFSRFENQDGLLEDLESWVFVEWSKANDFVKGVNYPSNMLYASMLDAAADLYSNFKDEKVKANNIRKTVREQSFNGEFFVDNALRENGELKLTDNISETCQYYAFFFGTVTREEYPQLFLTLLEKFGPNRDCGKVYPNVHPSNAFMGNYLRLSIMLDQGLKQKVIDESLEYFYKMATLTGTLWEHDQVRASLDHGFASYAACLLSKCL